MLPQHKFITPHFKDTSTCRCIFSQTILRQNWVAFVNNENLTATKISFYLSIFKCSKSYLRLRRGRIKRRTEMFASVSLRSAISEMPWIQILTVHTLSITIDKVRDNIERSTDI